MNFLTFVSFSLQFYKSSLKVQCAFPLTRLNSAFLPFKQSNITSYTAPGGQKCSSPAGPSPYSVVISDYSFGKLILKVRGWGKNMLMDQIQGIFIMLFLHKEIEGVKHFRYLQAVQRFLQVFLFCWWTKQYVISSLNAQKYKCKKMFLHACYPVLIL